MVAIDANLLLYAYNRSASEHVAAQRWLEETFASSETIGLPLQSVLAFLRVSTKRGLLKNAKPIEDALAIVDTWLLQPQVKLLRPQAMHWTLFRQLCLVSDGSGNLITDAHIAALAIEHNATLATADRDFARFPGLRWNNPLAQ